MAKAEHQVRTANNSFVDAEGSRSITFYVDRTNAKPAKVVLQHVLQVPASGANNLPSIIQLMRKGVNFYFTLNVATASLGSGLVDEETLINGLFLLNATSASVSKPSVAVNGPQSTGPNSKAFCDAPISIPKISKVYSNIRPAVDNNDILVWHARLGHLSLPAIKRLPNTVKGIQLHSRSPSTSTGEACIMGKIFRKPFHPSEDKA